jgi:1-pyrroline-5-carboxylate dehydrogenase
MMHGMFRTPPPRNEEVLSYGPATPERAQLKETLRHLAAEQPEIPLVINGKDVRTGNMGQCRMPHHHRHVLANYHKGNAETAQQAIQAAHQAWGTWARMPWESRAAIFLRAADMLTGRYRYRINAATMLGLSKTAQQAEIDAVAELGDFLRFNVQFMAEIYQNQPLSPAGQWNMLEWRPLEGFVFAVTPFNFTAIAGNLPTAPALMGNTVIWKPASSAVYPAYHVMSILQEAGLPPGVINLVPGSGGEVGNPVLTSNELAGLHFTGSTATFRRMWQVISQHIEPNRYWPRIVGETGGKDFIVAHPSAKVSALVTAIIRGGFEFQGQKCSAVSRCYIPESIWPAVKEQLLDELATVRMGDVSDFGNFMGAVIDKGAFDTIDEYLKYAKAATDATVLCGGESDDSEGYFIQPTIIHTTNPRFRTMEEEIFGPVVTIYVYPDSEFTDILRLCDQTSPYALTGAIFARDRSAIVEASNALYDAAGNFYINDKPTGAVVGQQPFGGARASGTNDKAGSSLNLLRWVSPRTIKETFDPPTNYRYPYMASDE